MRKSFCSLVLFTLVSYAPLVLAQAPPAPQAQVDDHSDHDHDHEHGHGPHDGELLEVGKEEFHVELCVDDEKNQMVVYLMDKQIKSYIAIDQQFIAVNMKVQGKPIQFKLKPTAQESDPKGYSSCFQIVSSDLINGLHAEDADARLVIKIGNKQYNVKVLHDHDHDHAGHDHGDHAGHNHGPAQKKK